MRYCKFTILTFLTLMPVLLQAQSFNTYLKNFQNGYQDVESLKIRLNIVAYSDSLKSDILHESIITLEKDKDKYHYYYGDVEIIANASYYLIVNHYNRFIQIKARNKQFEKNYINDISNLDIDSLIQNFEKPKLLSQRGEILIYRISLENADLNKIDFIVNKSSQRINTINYHFLDGQYVEINFSEYSESPHFQKDFPYLNKFLEISNDKIFLKEDYSNYTLLK